MSNEAKRSPPVRLVVGLLLGVGAFYLLVMSMMDGGTYFLTVDEAMASERVATDRPIRVKGTVMPGTYAHADGTSVHRFEIQGGERKMSIYYEGPIPDVFAEGREVIAEGTLGVNGVLVATEVTAKCPSKYEGGIPEEARKAMGMDAPTAGQPTAGQPPSAAPVNTNGSY